MLLLRAVILVGVLLALISAVRFQAPELLGQHKVLTDFDAFYIAGHLAADGRASDAYHISTMLAAQREMTGTHSFMPWTYPPPFTLLMQGLTKLPIGFSFLFFALASLTFYLWVLRRIAGPWMPGVVVAIMPVILLNLRTGQNGFLIAGLIGAFLLASRDGRRIAGLPLGLLIIKPHLGVAAGLQALVQRRWSVLTIAVAAAFGLLAISTMAYGIRIWTDFQGAVGEASGFLASRQYPLFRMNSIYACASSLGASPTTSMILQTVSATGALIALGYASVKGLSHNCLAALVCAASICVSPYGYDYDLTILGVGLAFIIPEILKRSTTQQYLALMALSWLACGYGMGWTVITGSGEAAPSAIPNSNNAGLSLTAPALALLFLHVFNILKERNPEKAR